MTTEITNETKNRAKPHLSHCCAVHGCKYYGDPCPVEMMEEVQMYLCEECPDSVSEADKLVIEAILLRDHVKRVLDNPNK